MSKTLSCNPPGTDFSRFVIAQALSRGMHRQAVAIAQERWPDSPGVALTLRAVQDAQDTSTALASYGIERQIVELLRETSVVERLRSRMFPGLFRAPIPVETTQPDCTWVGEGDPTPVTAAVLGSVTLDLNKLGTISALTDELVRISGPDAEAAIRRLIINALGYTIDQQFLTSGVIAVTGQRPGAVTSGLAATASTGSTATAIATDLSTMVEALTTFRDPVWVMRPATFSYISAHNDGNILQYVGGQPILLGFPVFKSLGTPQQISLIDLGGITIAAGGIEITVSRETSLEMSSTPIAGDESPITAATLKSLWQNNMLAVKCLRQISWKRTSDGAVKYMAVNY